MSKFSRFLLATVFAVGMSFVSYGETVDPSAFEMKIEYAVSGYSGSTTITDLPVLVRLRSAEPSGFSYARCPQDSIRFSDADGNLIPHEVDTWNTSGESTIWVKVPSVSGQTTAFTMYFGGEGAKPAALDAKSVWSNYAAVFHGGAQSYANAVGNAIVGSAGSDKVTVQNGACKVGGGINKSSCNYKPFNFTNPVKAGVLASVKNMTMSGWFCPDKYKNDSDTLGTGILMCSRSAWDDANNKNGFALMCEAGTWLSLSIGAAHNPSSKPSSQPSFAWLKNQWNYYAFTYQTVGEDETFATYCNGAVCSTGTPGNKLDDSGNNDYWGFGGLADASKVDNFRGDMDELRVFNGVASADYIAAEYATIGADFVTTETGATFISPMSVLEYARRIDFSLSDSAKAALAGTGVQVVPVAVRLSSAIEEFSYSDFNADHTDILFGRERNGKIVEIYPYEIERWDADGETIVWVRVPVDAEGEGFSLFYGKDKVYVIDPTDVWSGYVGVWHMAEESGTVADATGNGLTATPKGTTAQMTSVEGVVGGARINATSAVKNYYSIPSYSGVGGAFTISAFVKVTAKNGYHRLFSRKDSYTEVGGFEFENNNGDLTKYTVRGTNNDKTGTITVQNGAIDAWTHFMLAFNGNAVIPYVDGVKGSSIAINAATDNSKPLSIGNNSNGSESSLVGDIDEVRLNRSAVSDDYAKAEYLAMTPGFLTNGGSRTLDPEAPELGECALTKVRDGEYRVDGVMAKNGAAVKLVFSAEGGEVVEKALGEQAEGVPFTTSITKADGLSDAYPYDVKIVVASDHGAQERSLGVIALWRPTSVNDFAKKFTVTLPDTFVGELVNFPVLVRLSSTAVDGFSYDDVCQNGVDFVVVDGEGNMLPCQFEVYNPDGESLLWVKFPLARAGASLSVYYGNRKSMVETPVPTEVWNDYAGVWHLNETTAGSTTIVDAAGVQDGTSHASSTAVAEGVFGGARGLDLDAKNGGMVVVPQTEKLNQLVPSFTVSGWVKPHTLSLNWGYLFSRKTADSYASWGLQFRGSNGNSDSVGIYSNGSADNDSNRAVVNTKGKWTANVWQKYDVVYTDTTVSLYINGVLVDSAKAVKPGAAVNGDNDFAIGGFPTKTNHGTIKADQDEVRLRIGAVSADWIADEYAMQSGTMAAELGAVEPVDASAPVFDEPTATVANDGTVSVTVTVTKGEGDVSVFCDDGETAVGAIGTDIQLNTPVVVHPTIAAGRCVAVYAYGVNAAGTEVVKPMKSGVMNAAVVVAETSHAYEDGRVPGIFTVSRPGTATAQTLIVNLAWSGTAEAGIDYEDNLPATVTIPAGETAVTVEVTPIINMAKTFDTTVICTVTEGPYIAGGTATLTIKNVELDDRFNTWVGGGADDKASTAANWSLGVPVNGQAILFDGRFANPNNKNCDWDIATDTVASWTQNNGYDGTITLRTVYPGKSGMEVLTVTGAMNIESGTLTHPQSRTMGDNHNAQWDWIGDLKANETYRIRIACDSFNLGAAARVDVATKGYYASHDSARCNASHGGTTQKDAAVYGDPKEPIHIGLAHRVSGNYNNGKGGGAIYITVTGAAVVDGVISADSGNTGYGAGAAGSVYLKAASVTGAGSITAIGSATGEGNYKGTGGRVAIVTETPVNRATFAKISAETEWKNAQGGQATHFGSCGTVFFKDKDHANGILVVAGKSDWPVLSWSNRYRVTPVGTDGDWTFDAVELGRGGMLAVLPDTEIRLPGGLTSVSSTSDNAGCNGIKYEGGTLDIGSNANQTMSGKWMLFAPSNCVINANVTVQGGAMIGVPEYGSITEEGSVLPEFPSCTVTVNGDLTITSDGLMKADKCGLRKGANNTEKGLVGYHSHGGRTLAYGKTLRLHYQGYDSVFNPCLPGCTVPHTGGQGAGNAGGVLNCTVSGVLTIDGTVSANGSLGGQAVTHNDNAGPGGAIKLTSGMLVGSGVIRADGGYNGGNSSGGGGRVAIRLTRSGASFADFTGTIVASGRYSQDVANASHSSSAGSVYLETAADGEKGGVIRIAQGLNYAQNALNTNTTEIVSLGYGGDNVADYKNVKLEVRDYGFAAVNTDVTMKSVTLATADAKLDLEGHTLTVKSAKLMDKVLAAGTYAAGDAALGDFVTDSVGGGSLVVQGGTRSGLKLILR